MKPPRRLRIVNDSGMGHTTRILDATTGDDLTPLLKAVAADIHIGIGQVNSITLTLHDVEIDVIAEEAS